MRRLLRPVFRILDDLPQRWWDFLTALGLNLILLAVIALVLWPMGKAVLAFRLAKGYAIFWLVVYVVAPAVAIIQRIFRLNVYDHSAAYVASGLFGSAVLVTGWSAFAALTLHGFVGGTSVWVAAIIWLFGFLSSCIAYFVVGTYYVGEIYKFVSLPLALASFVVFAIWPAIGGALYGWFFAFF